MSKTTFDTSLIWYLVFVAIVLFFSLAPIKPYYSKWQSSMAFADSVGMEQDPKIKLELAQEGLNRIMPIYEEFPYHPRIQMTIGYLYFLSRNLDSSIHYINLSLEKGKEGIVNSIVPMASQILTSASLEKAIELINKGDTLQAIELYQNALQYSPQHPILNKNLALYYLSKSDIQNAIAYYNTAFRSDKNDESIKNGLARCYHILGKRDSVMYYTNLVLSKNPNNAEARSIQNSINQ